MRSLKTRHKTSSIALAVWHAASSSWNQMLPISFSSTFVNKNSFNMDPIPIAIDCNGLSLLIFEEKWPNYAPWPKSALNSDSFCVRVYCAANATILLVYILAKIKKSFISKDEFFFLPKSASSVSQSQAHTTYSFGGSIKLIICQIRQELSVTIHDPIFGFFFNFLWQLLFTLLVFARNLPKKYCFICRFVRDAWSGFWTVASCLIN